MAGISATLSQEDLAFMAEDIGPELVPFLQPEAVVKGLNAEKRRKLISLLKVEDLLGGISPENQAKLLALLLEMRTTDAMDSEEKNGNRIN